MPNCSITGFEGRETGIVEKEISFVLGSGNHTRIYLHQTLDGRLLALPLAWYAEKGGYVAMAPGYDRPDHMDYRREIGFECMFCHNAYPRIAAGADAPGRAPVYAGELPSGIDCQRCHGPGAEHAASAGRRSIVNPARLTRERQLEICMQCHLESTGACLMRSGALGVGCQRS